VNLRADEIAVVEDRIAMPLRFTEAFIESVSQAVTISIEVSRILFTSQVRHVPAEPPVLGNLARRSHEGRYVPVAL
jgi:hypothetical protein